MKIAMIPVRSGSKRLPKKNYLPFGENSILERCIEKTKSCKKFDRIILNTDDIQLEEISKKHSIEIYIRSKDLANDEATSDRVVLDFFKKFSPSSLYWVNTASPLSKVEDINKVVTEFENSNANSVISINKKSVHAICTNKPVNFNHQDSSFAKTQELEPIFLYNYALMAWKFEYCDELKKGFLFNKETLMVETSIFSSFLLKDEEDYKFLKSIENLKI